MTTLSEENARLAPAEPGRPSPAISAHRGGCEFGPRARYAAYETALAAGAEYLEIDVRRTADGALVGIHDGRIGSAPPVSLLTHRQLCKAAGYEVPEVFRLLELMAGRAAAHIDVKDPAVMTAVVERSLELLGPDGFVVTTGNQAAISAVRHRYPAVSAALTIGGDWAQAARHVVLRTARAAAAWADKVQATGANWAAINERLARTGVAAQCRRRGLRTLVWTVNGDANLRYWLASPDVDVLVTDQPARALTLRAERAG